ncbi:MAG: hypothetical protein AAGI11_08360, partial [Pseudomonadota bacterium]
VTDVLASVDAAGRTAELLSAFFGLDNQLPRASNLGICDGAAGKDGMPVIFSHELDIESVQAGDFEVRTESGKLGQISCVTLAPADDFGEWRTVLVVGELGSADDQPSLVRIVGHVLSIDKTLNFRGREVGVVRLENGPSLSWSETVPAQEWNLGRAATRLPWGGGSACPEGTAQVIRVTWQGGVTLPGGDEVDDSIRLAYEVTVAGAQGKQRLVRPFSLGDKGDSDNNHLLCLDATDPAVSVYFPANLVTDPNEDLNPATRQTVMR